MTITAPALFPPVIGRQVDQSGGRRELDRNPAFRDIARSLNDGWAEIEEHAKRLAEESGHLPPALTQVDPATVAAELISADPLTTQAAIEKLESLNRERDREVHLRQLLHNATEQLSQRGNKWIIDHEAELCEAIDAQRQRIHNALAALLPDLEPLDGDPGKVLEFPNSTPAINRAVELLAEWDAFTRMHLLLVPASAEAEKRWEGVTWVAHYEKDWKNFFRNVHILGVRFPDKYLQSPPWSTEVWRMPAVSWLIRAVYVGKYAVWTPTQAQLEARLKRLDVDAYEMGAEFAEEMQRKEEVAKRPPTRKAGFYDPVIAQVSR